MLCPAHMLGYVYATRLAVLVAPPSWRRFSAGLRKSNPPAGSRRYKSITWSHRFPVESQAFRPAKNNAGAKRMCRVPNESAGRLALRCLFRSMYSHQT